MLNGLLERILARAAQLSVSYDQLEGAAGIGLDSLTDVRETEDLQKVFESLSVLLKVDRSWLLTGLGFVEGESPQLEHLACAFTFTEGISDEALLMVASAEGLAVAEQLAAFGPERLDAAQKLGLSVAEKLGYRAAESLGTAIAEKLGILPSDLPGLRTIERLSGAERLR